MRSPSGVRLYYLANITTEKSNFPETRNRCGLKIAFLVADQETPVNIHRPIFQQAPAWK
jgi:hypothetical protein